MKKPIFNEYSVPTRCPTHSYQMDLFLLRATTHLKNKSNKPNINTLDSQSLLCANSLEGTKNFINKIHENFM